MFLSESPGLREGTLDCNLLWYPKLYHHLILKIWFLWLAGYKLVMSIQYNFSFNRDDKGSGSLRYKMIGMFSGKGLLKLKNNFDQISEPRKSVELWRQKKITINQWEASIHCNWPMVKYIAVSHWLIVNFFWRHSQTLLLGSAKHLYNQVLKMTVCP